MREGGAAMGLFRKTVTRYVDASGKRCAKNTPGAQKVRSRLESWYGRYVDAEGIRREQRLCKDKTAARQMLNGLVLKAERVKVGIEDRFEAHHQQPLSVHLTAFRSHLDAKGNTVSHVSTTLQRVKAIVDGCRFKRIGDISASAVATWLKNRRAADGSRDENGRQIRFGIASSNHHLTAIKAFSRWLVTDRRTDDDRLAHLSRLNQATDVRRKRRHLTIEEFSMLIDITSRNGECAGLSGPDRSMLYLIAGYTGLRASELASLNVSSFDLEEQTITVEAGYSKHRREDVLPLHPELVLRLREWLPGRDRRSSDEPSVLAFPHPADLSQIRLWSGTWAENRHGAEMLRHDLKATRIPYKDHAGRVFDFHALRHQFISMLAAAGVHPKAAQELARHSDINLTMSKYTHIKLNDLKNAIGEMPGVQSPQKFANVVGNDPLGKLPHKNSGSLPLKTTRRLFEIPEN